MNTELRGSLSVAFDANGLAPAIVRDAASGRVLTLAWMNAESLERTMETGETWLWSRSRKELWHKGATSGNRQKVVSMKSDCDRDAILVDVAPMGPACHTGAESCFGDDFESSLGLEQLAKVLESRKREMPEGSYSAKLFARGTDRILKKIGEESTEVILAAKGEGRERLVSEVADLLFHVTALLVNERIPLSEVGSELRGRRK